MKLFPINAGEFYCDGGAMFGVVPKRVWSKRYPCNDDNFCKLVMRCLLVETDERLMLIDTGCGDKQLDYLKYYKFSGVVNFEVELQRLGYSCSDVTDVVFTHLHFDHCGGATRYDENNQLVLTFPNAKHWVGEAQWHNFLNPNVREGNSYFSENMLPIEAAGKLQLLTQNTYITPEVELRLCHGHTKGQIVTLMNNVALDEKTCYLGDVIPMAAALPIAWVSAYDTDPVKSMEEKELLLSEAAKEDWTLFFEHDAYFETVKIKEINGKFLIK